MPAALPGDALPQHETASTPDAEPTPLVSVVVPIYNVERYLAECLESLAHQSLRDLEVIMVDDGATDSSATIAAAFARDDDRFTLVRQANGGLGHARNTGTRHARGQYLAFVDSDDIVTETAYERMAGSLERTGSDFATGNFHRLTAAGTRQAGMVFTAFNASRARTHIRKHPALLNDRTAWNKLFRRSFWDANDFSWPEGVLYEDIPVTLPAHVLAGAVDVVREPVYLWRARVGDSASITQRRVEPRAVDDRFNAVDGVSRFMAARGETTLKALYDKSVAAQDLRYFLQHLDEGDHVFQDRFLDLANDFFDRAAPDVFDDLPAVQRLEWHLVRRRLLPELLEVVSFENSGEVALTPFVRRGRRIIGDYPYRGDPSVAVPEDVYLLGRDELPMPARVEDVWWEGETLHLSGFAYIAFLPLDSAGSGRLRLTLEESGHPDRVVALEVTKVRRPDVTAAAPDGTTNYDWSGWTASVPATAMRHRGRFRTGSWRLRVEVKVAGITRRAWLAATGPGRAQRPDPLVLGPTRITPTTPAGKFAVQVSTTHAQVERATLDGHVLELGARLFGRAFDHQTASLRLARDDGTASHEVPVATDVADDGEGTPFLTRIDLRALRHSPDGPDQPSSARETEDQGDGAGWALGLRPGADGRSVPLLAAPDLPELRVSDGAAEVVVRSGRTGTLMVIDRTLRPEVQEAAWVEGVLRLSGRYDASDQGRCDLVLVEQDRGVALAVPVTLDDGRFTTHVDPTAMPTAAGTVRIGPGRWHVYLRRTDADAEPGDASRLVRVKVAPSALAMLPATRTSPTATATRSSAGPVATVQDVDQRSLMVLVARDLAPAEESRAGQQRLRRSIYPAAAARPPLDQVLVDGYANGRYGEDVRAVLEELAARGAGVETVWTTQDGLAATPPAGRRVPRRSSEWYTALARSRYVVTTDLLGIEDLATRPDQVVLHVGHGIPARPIGLDDEVARDRLGRRGAERLQAEARRWDLVLSAGPAHSTVLRAAYGLPLGTAALLETGLPRHDLLASPGLADVRAARAAEARERLGISAGRRVVLYAPSHRPRQEVAPDRYPLDLRLDPAALAAALGPDHVLLVRPHPKVVDGSPRDGGVLDGTFFPDVRDLVLLADVLVTDHSSLLFDFALTGRPMVFFAPPEPQHEGAPERYLQPDDLPGPQVHGLVELAEAVRRADDEISQHADAYARLRHTWLPQSNGAAGARAVDALLSAGDPPATEAPTTMEET